ncbi:MAG: hypothetical protein WD152_01985, partial [Nitriliruptoraceae bacterium]
MTDAVASPPPQGDDTTSPDALEGSKLDEIIATRRAKVAAMRDAGIEPYPVRFRPTSTIAEIRATHDGLAPGEGSGVVSTVAGRVVARRQMGRLQFLV